MASKKKPATTTTAPAAPAASENVFVISNRRAGRDAEQMKRSRNTLDSTFAASLVHSVRILGDTTAAGNEADGRRVIVLEATLDEITEKVKEFGADIIVEPEYPRHTLEFSIGELGLRNTVPLPAGTGASIHVRLTSGGQPVAGAGVILALASKTTPATTAVQNVSAADGTSAFPYDASVYFPKMLVIEPRSGYWPAVVNTPPLVANIDLVPLPKTGPMGWWQALVGNPGYAETRGQGIRIGIVDTGVGPNTYVQHVTGVGAFIRGTLSTAAGATNDAEDHGTHVSGIIGARPPVGSSDFGGIAAGADIFMARVFATGQPANQGDIASAIEALSGTYSADLINLSLGGAYSEIELDAVLIALQQGTLCICAAGNNSGGPVLYPAAYQQTIAVSALGLLDTFPQGSTSFMNQPSTPDKFGTGGLFLPTFSNIGPQIKCTAPGNAIISTVPVWNQDAAPYAAMDGTSMASPIATGATAVRLSQDPRYLALPRNRDRAMYAFTAVLAGAVTVGLATPYQGAGLARI